MNIQIIGLGMVGSSIANNLLQMNYIKRLNLTDRNYRLLRGQYYDLYRVKELNKLDATITISPEIIPVEHDYNIISVGYCTEYDKYIDNKDAIQALFNKNYPIVRDIVRKIEHGKIIIVTNPSDRITEILKIEFPRKDIVYAGNKVDKICDGKLIKTLKGYTNWGIATEVLNLIFPNRQV